MKTQELLNFIQSVKTDENVAIIEAMQDAVVIIMVDDEDDMPIKNRFTLNNNKAVNKKTTASERSGNKIDNQETETVLLSLAAGVGADGNFD